MNAAFSAFSLLWREGMADERNWRPVYLGAGCDGMTQINPFTGAIIQGMQVQPRQGAEKDRQVRRVQNLSKNSALQGDELEHQVESAVAPHATDDGQENAYNPQRRSTPQQAHHEDDSEDGGTPHVDVTA